MITSTEKVTIYCDATGETAEVKTTSKGTPRLPKGWKRLGDELFCAKAYKERFRLAAIILPVAGLHIDESGMSEEQIKSARAEGWKALRESMKESWGRSTELANWVVQTLLANDVTRDPETGKLPPMPKTYLYGERDFTGWSNTASSTIREVEQDYRKKRGEMLFFGRRRLPDFRYPFPWICHNNSWTAEMDDGKPVVSFRTFSGRILVKLKGGKRYRRQLAGFRQIAEGAKRGTLSVYKHRSTGDVMVKMISYLPRNARDNEKSGTLHVRTDSHSFIVSLNEKDERLFVINGDWMRKQQRKHYEWQQRFREDLKLEQRRPHKQKKQRMKPMRDGAQKYQNRLDSFVKETAANVVNYADRRRIACITYDDSEKEYFGSNFPYFALEQRLQQKCYECGIEFEGKE